MAPNLTASVVDEQTLLKRAPRVEGRIDIPDRKAGVLIHPAGRMWEYFRELLLHRGGAIVILGTIALLAWPISFWERSESQKGGRARESSASKSLRDFRIG